MINQLKNWLKKFWKWLIVGSVAVAIAATILPPEQIPDDLLLKAPKEKVLMNSEVDWIACDNKTGKCQNKGRIIRYDYISDAIVGEANYRGLAEDLSKRTGNAQFFKSKDILKDGKKIKEEWVANFYGGTPFWKVGDEWHQTETATTTIDAFQKQTKPSVFERIMGRAFAACPGSPSCSEYASSSDETMSWDSEASWTIIRDNANAESVTSGNAALYMAYDGTGTPTQYDIKRGYFPFDTSALPDNATISSTSISFYIQSKANLSSVQDWINLMASSTAPGYSVAPANPSTLAIADWDMIGNTEISDRKDLTTDLPTGTYNTWSIIAPYNDTRANGGIIDAVNPITPNDNTKGTLIGARAGKDFTNTTPVGTDDVTGAVASMSETAGTNQDPYVSITYTAPAVTVTPGVQIIIFE